MPRNHTNRQGGRKPNENPALGDVCGCDYNSGAAGGRRLMEGTALWWLRLGLCLSAHRTPTSFKALPRKLRPEFLELLDCIVVRIEVGDDRINDVDAGVLGL